MNQFVKETDWKIYRDKIAVWQERHMEKLNREYMELLGQNGIKASEKFWKLEERINMDKCHPSVICKRSRSTMMGVLVELLMDEVITVDDLSDFSEELQKDLLFLSSCDK